VLIAQPSAIIKGWDKPMATTANKLKSIAGKPACARRSASVPAVKAVKSVAKVKGAKSTAKGLKGGGNASKKDKHTEASEADIVSTSKDASLLATMGAVPITGDTLLRGFLSQVGGEPGCLCTHVEYSDPAQASVASEVKAKKPRGNKRTTIARPLVPVKMWFVIGHLEGKSKVLSHGSQVECITYVSEIAKHNPGLKANVFIANGLQLITYDVK
jgi:hypothetical protein